MSVATEVATGEYFCFATKVTKHATLAACKL